jgi:hypothetical protein
MPYNNELKTLNVLKLLYIIDINQHFQKIKRHLQKHWQV